jgi:nucleoside-diphosphate-sugar epimerase
MSTCLIFGGAGYIGTFLTRRVLENGRFDHVHIADIRPSPLAGERRVTFSLTDVREPIPPDLAADVPDWIVNLAAVHREPGHEPHEYYQTNIPGADNVCRYAEMVDCHRIYFASSISVYGPTLKPTAETVPCVPTTPYGGSKYAAESIHRAWQRSGPGRRLVICRPGVIYGPGDPGNIMRMIKAIRRGYFAFPGSPDICKSYGYICGLLDSIEFTMDMENPFFCCNYVETPTERLRELVRQIKSFFGARALIFPVPMKFLLPVAKAVQALGGEKNPIHPVRVRKAATPTHIVPQALKEAGFTFKYDFSSSLQHWLETSPDDFGLTRPAGRKSLTLRVPRKDAVVKKRIIETEPELVENKKDSRP